MPEKKIQQKRKAVSKSKIREIRKTARRVFLDPSTPSAWTVARVVLVAFVVWHLGGIIAEMLSALTHLLFMVVISIFFAYLINPLVRLIRQPFKQRNLEKLMPRPLAIIISYLIVFSILGVGIANLAPRIANQGREFAENLPSYAVMIQDGITELNNRYDRLNISQEVQNNISLRINSVLDSSATFITKTISDNILGVISYLPWLILVPILAFFFLKDIHFFKESFLGFFPSGRWRARAESVLGDVNTTIAGYTRAQLISCLLIGFVSTVAFYLLGVKYALLLGILAGLFEFVPLIGPLTIGLLSISVAGFSGSPLLAFWTMLFMVALRLTHDYVTYPRIVQEGIRMHPLAVILSILAGEQIAGISGVFLSIPVVALLTVLYGHILDHTGRTGLLTGLLQSPETRKKVKKPDDEVAPLPSD